MGKDPKWNNNYLTMPTCSPGDFLSTLRQWIISKPFATCKLMMYLYPSKRKKNQEEHLTISMSWHSNQSVWRGWQR